MRKQQKQSGFTLIELIVVVVVLSTLAAVFFPIFINLEEEAEAAANEATAGSLNASIKTARVQWLLAGSPGRVQNLQGFADGTIDFNTDGWPIGVNKGSANDNIGRGNGGCVDLWNNLLISAATVSTNASADYQSFRHSSNRQCSFVLRRSGDTSTRTNALLGIRYFSQSGEVTACGRNLQTSC